MSEISKLVALLPNLEERLPDMSPRDKQKVLKILESLYTAGGWPLVYFNRETLKVYTPHHQAERDAVYQDTPTNVLFVGSEGSGKSVAGIIKDLDRIKRRMSGVMFSPNLPHFQRSLWKEFQRWCPWDLVVPNHRRMATIEWMPVRPFDIVFENSAYIHCVGVTDVGSLEGPNLNWAHFDEARLHPDASALKVLPGRIRIDGPNGEPPQSWFTTTPRMNWLYDFFGPLKCFCTRCGDCMIHVQKEEPVQCPKCKGDVIIRDEFSDFKMDSRVVKLHIRDNLDNVTKGFMDKRRQSLTDAEAAVLIDAEWVDMEAPERFLPSMSLWDVLQEDLPPLTPYEPMVVSLDASEKYDSFALIGVTRHPLCPDERTAVRIVRCWEPGGKLLDYRGTEDDPGPEPFLIDLWRKYDVTEVAIDPTQLHDFSMRLGSDPGLWFRRFGQAGARLEADRQLLDTIVQRRIAHSGNPFLRRHLDNANRKNTLDGRTLRIVKRGNLHIDLAVGLSMANSECWRLNL